MIRQMLDLDAENLAVVARRLGAGAVQRNAQLLLLVFRSLCRGLRVSIRVLTLAVPLSMYMRCARRPSPHG